MQNEGEEGQRIGSEFSSAREAHTRLFIRRIFFFGPFFSFSPVVCVHRYYTMSGVVNSEVKSSTAAEAPVETGHAGDNQNNDKPTVHVFNEQTNYVPKRTIITVCIHVY